MEAVLGGLHPGSTREVSGEGETLSGEALGTLIDRLAGKLARLGARRGEPVHVRIGNRPADIVALFAVWRIDAVAVPEHIATPPRVAAALRARTGARFMVDHESVVEIAATRPPRRPLLDGAALIVFTSGSTGEPKGVVIDRGRFAAKIQVLGRLLAIQESDTVLVPLQLTFIFGIWVSVLSIGVGARLVLMPKFAPAAAGQLLADNVSIMACVPTMLRSLVAEPPPRASRLRAILTGGEPLGEALTLSLGRTFSEAGISDLYGLTETGSCDFHLMPKDQPAGIGSIGVPTERVSYRIAEAADGIGGELQIKTPFGMLGYLDAPELTREAFADSYFKTGDLARVRPDGRVELVGRAKDIISRGGYKIAPLEVEGMLARHPDVAAALCAGVPDARLGECIHAVVVPRAGTAPDAQSIRAWAADRIEHYKLPDVIHLRESLPLGRTGKADRAAIATIAAQG